MNQIIEVFSKKEFINSEVCLVTYLFLYIHGLMYYRDEVWSCIYVCAHVCSGIIISALRKDNNMCSVNES